MKGNWEKFKTNVEINWKFSMKSEADYFTVILNKWIFSGQRFSSVEDLTLVSLCTY